MGEKEIIDCFAFGGKVAVELSHIKGCEKELWKHGIDVAADILKMAICEPLTVQQIQEVAKQCNMECVVVLQCMVNGEERILFKMSGGDTLAFCQRIGIQMFPESAVSTLVPYISEVEEQYGFVLYERKG